MGELAVIPEAVPAVDVGLHDPERFLASCDVKPSSRASYDRALHQFVLWFDENQVVDPTPDHILRYKRYLLEEKGLSDLTVSHYLVVVRRFFAWMESERRCLNIARNIKGAGRSRGFRKDKLTKAQALQLLGSIDRSGLRGKRDYALVNLLIRTGLRTIEVVRADRGDIRQDDEDMVLDVQGKGRSSKDEIAVLTEETLPAIREYLSAQDKARRKSKCKPRDTDPLFMSVSGHNQWGRLTTRSVSRICKERLRAIGLDSRRLTAHSLRHTALTFGLRGGASPLALKNLGRHEDFNTTMRYIHAGERIKHAAERNIDAFLAEG